MSTRTTHAAPRMLMNERNVLVDHYISAGQEGYDILMNALSAKCNDNNVVQDGVSADTINSGFQAFERHIRSIVLDIVTLRKPAILCRIQLEIALHRVFNKLCADLELVGYVNQLLPSTYLPLSNVGEMCEEATTLAAEQNWGVYRKAELNQAAYIAKEDPYVLDSSGDGFPGNAFFAY